MKKIFIVCEGRTEVNFVKQVLCPYFVEQNKVLIPLSVLTQRDNKLGKMYKGGMRSFKKAHSTIVKTLTNVDENTFVTTMFDFYGLPSDTPGMYDIVSLTDPYEKVELLESKIAAIDNYCLKFPAYFPYIQLHEFETLLFSDIDKIEEKYFDRNVEKLRQCVQRHSNPELINSGKDTAPSKRILQCIPDYDKTTVGVLILECIGMNKLRQSCKHFSQWIDKLESL